MAVEVRAAVLLIADAAGDTILNLDAVQGLWTGEQYLRLTDYSRRLIELTDGSIEVLPMPTERHQAILRFLHFALYELLQQIGGAVVAAPFRMQIREGKFREPDVLVLRDGRDPRRRNAYWLGADLVIEIIGADSIERDTVVKRADYAEADIPEYWIVHPEEETIVVLRLEGGEYTE